MLRQLHHHLYGSNEYVLLCLNSAVVAAYKGEATWCSARENPGVSVGIEEGDIMHCKFITSARHLVLVLRPVASPTHSRELHLKYY